MSELNHPLRIEETPLCLYLFGADNYTVASAENGDRAQDVIRFAALASQAQEVLRRRKWELRWLQESEEWDLDIEMGQHIALFGWTPPDLRCLYALIVDTDEELKRREAKP